MKINEKKSNPRQKKSGGGENTNTQIMRRDDKTYLSRFHAKHTHTLSLSLCLSLCLSLSLSVSLSHTHTHLYSRIAERIGDG
jgi:hypothetical protein